MSIGEKNMKEALKFSFPKTMPIMAGYLFLGASFGILAVSQGISPLITALMSLLIFAGSMQFAAVNILQASFNPIGALMLTLMVNARHIFYGITMLKPDRKSTRLNSSHVSISYDVFCLKQKKN